jgi:undecaprenyl-diphosphatase
MSILEYLISLDKEVFLFLNGLGNPIWDDFWNIVTYRYTWVPFYLFLITLIYKNKGWKITGVYILMMLITVTIVDQSTTHMFKNFFERLRPSHNDEFVDLIRITGRKGGMYGFVSAHASNTFAIAVLLGVLFKNRYKNAIYFLLLWSSFVAYSRIYVGVHYPGDILGGALWGSFVAAVILFILKKSPLYRKITL